MLKELKSKSRKSGMKGIIITFIIMAILFYYTKTELLIVLRSRSLEYIPDKSNFIFFCIVYVIMFLIIIHNLIQSFSNKAVKQIIALSQADSECSLSDIEADYYNAEAYGKNLLLGQKYIFDIFVTATCTPIKDIVWAFHETRTRKGYTSHSLILCKADKKTHSISLDSAEDIDDVLIQLSERNHALYIGYTKDWNTQYQKNTTEFVSRSRMIDHSIDDGHIYYCKEYRDC